MHDDHTPQDKQKQKELLRRLDCETIQSIMEDFYALTGLPVAVIDLSGNILVKIGWRAICDIFHRQNPQCHKNCLDSDVSHSVDAILGEFKLYKCKNHLWDIATPLFVEDQHVANLYFGQFFFEDEKVDMGIFRAQAQTFGFNEEEYLKAVTEVPRYSKEKVAQIMSFYTKMGSLISNLSHNRKLLEQSLIERDTMLNSLNLHGLILDQIADGVTITDLNGIITYVNSAECRNSGFDKHALLGRNVSVFGEDPEQGDSQEEVIKRTLEEGSYTGVVTNIKENGQKTLVEVRTNLIRDSKGEPIALAGISTDITDRMANMQRMFFQRKVDKAMLKFSSRLLNVRESDLDLSIAEIMAEIGDLLGLDRVHLFGIDNQKKLLYSKHEWCAQDIDGQHELMQGLPTSDVSNWMASLQDNGIVKVSHIGQLPDEWEREIETLELQSIISILDAPIRIKGELKGVLGFDSVSRERDWTDAETTVARMTANLISNACERIIYERELIVAKDKAEESDRIKSTFLAIVNHELRTPLNHILGYAQLLQADPQSPDLNEYVSQIYKSGSNLLRIIQDIFDLALSEQSQILPQPKLFVVQNHFEQNQQSLRDILNSSGKQESIKLIFKPDTSVPESEIFADASKINMVLHNLFKNAVKFTESGTIEFGFKFLAADRISYYIKDTGIGISKSMQESIFDIFSQAENANTRKFGGVGIGLPISKKLAEIMQGKIRLESQVGKGSTFYLELPTIIHSKAQSKKEKSKPSFGLDLSGKHVMVVDDENSILMLFKHYLRRSGAVFHQARNGEDAIDNLPSLPHGSVILMDLQMPVMDGFSATSQIKMLRQDLFIIAITGYATEADEKSLKLQGFDALIPKPVVKEALIKVLNDFCQRS